MYKEGIHFKKAIASMLPDTVWITVSKFTLSVVL